jgi:hypothetical protein
MVVASVVWGRCKNNRGSFLFLPEHAAFQPTRHHTFNNKIHKHLKHLLLFKDFGKEIFLRLFGNMNRVPHPKP